MNDNLAILHAIQNGNSTRVKSLIESGSFDPNAPLDWRVGLKAPLGIAARRNYVTIAEMLLNAGANVDSVDYKGMTACHYAALVGNAEVLTLLLARKPNLELRSRYIFNANTPLEIAVQERKARCVVLLIEAGASLDNRDTVCKAASLSTAVIEALVSRGIVVNTLRDVNGINPLRWVRDRAMFDFLLNVCKVELDAQDDFGQTPCFDAATVFRYNQLLRWLVDAGADIEIADRQGETPFLRASRFKNNDSCILTLLAFGANVHARRAADGRTACHIAAAVGRLWTLHALLAAGADLDVPDSGGCTARQVMLERNLVVDLVEIDRARQRIGKTRLDLVRSRALQVCVGLQSRGLDALTMCEILQHACGRAAPLIAFHHWWAIATKVKHFH